MGYQALVNLDPDLDPNRVVMALRVTSTSSSAGLGAVRWQADPHRRRASAEERKRCGVHGVVLGISERQIETPSTWTRLMPNYRR
jgi:hypothetical protein